MKNKPQKIDKLNSSPIQSKKRRAGIVFYPPMIVDNGPIRKKYIQAFKKISRDLDRAREDWTIFEQVDKPEFRKWLNLNFGGELTGLREMREKVKEMEDLLNEIEDCRYQNHMSFYHAHEFVMNKRANPEKYKDENSEYKFREEDTSNNSSSDSGDDYFYEDEEENKDKEEYIMNDEEMRVFFRSYLEETNPALGKTLSNNKLLFEAIFREFKDDYLANGPGASKRKKAVNRTGFVNEADKRLRDLYRVLVRRLHPDCRKETSLRYDEIWHEVQMAYRERNFERMEMLAALYDIHSGSFYDTGSLSQLIQVRKEYMLQLKALKAQTRQVKDDPAWGFSKKINRDEVGRYIKKDLTDLTGHLKSQLGEMEIVLSRWSTPPKQKNKMTQLKPKPVKKSPVLIFNDDIQMEFPF